MTDNNLLSRIVGAVAPVPGVRAIVLGGSRARGTTGPRSDYDIGLYYDPDRPLDVAALQVALAPLVDEPPAAITAPGDWGPWIDGGGWLRIDGIEVDLLYRSLAKVADVIAEAQEGGFTVAYQVGHPHAFCSIILAGEAAIAVPLHDPSGAFAELKARAGVYPERLRAALVGRFGWEVDFAIDNGRLSAARAERNHVAGCAFRALCCTAQVLFALNRQWLINEKGAVDAAAALPITIPGLTDIADRVWCDIGRGALDSALDNLSEVSVGLRALAALHGMRLPD